MKYYAIIVAGGSGSRMNSDIPKQFLLLHSKPVLMYTIEAFYQSDLKPEIILVLNPNWVSYWKELCTEHSFSIHHQLVRGGDQRFDSVKNGLALVQDPSVVSIHDAVRPIVSNELITRAFREAEKKGNAIAGIVSKDSVRQLHENHSSSLDRETIYLIQTPQTFKSEIIKEAYKQDYNYEFTDDASVLEKIGGEINIIKGDPYNIKITFPEDIKIAELLIGGDL